MGRVYNDLYKLQRLKKIEKEVFRKGTPEAREVPGCWVPISKNFWHEKLTLCKHTKLCSTLKGSPPLTTAET